MNFNASVYCIYVSIGCIQLSVDSDGHHTWGTGMILDPFLAHMLVGMLTGVQPTHIDPQQDCLKRVQAVQTSMFGWT